MSKPLQLADLSEQFDNLPEAVRRVIMADAGGDGGASDPIRFSFAPDKSLGISRPVSGPVFKSNSGPVGALSAMAESGELPPVEIRGKRMPPASIDLASTPDIAEMSDVGMQMGPQGALSRLQKGPPSDMAEMLKRFMPQDDSRGQYLALAAGLGGVTKTGRIGEVAGNVASSLGDFNAQQQKLKAQYVPLIMQKVAQQQLQAEQAQLRADAKAEALALKNQPQKRDAGSYYIDQDGKTTYWPKVGEGMTMLPNGHIATVPNAPQASAAIKGAETLATESAKAALDPLTFTPPGVGARPVMTNRLEKMTGQQAPTPAAPSAIAQPGQAIGAGVSASAPASTTPASAVPATGPQGVPMQSAMEAGQGKNITEATGKVNDSWLKTSYEPTVAGAKAAQNVIDTTQVARRAIANMGGTGWGTETKAAAAGVLTGLGIASDKVQLYASDANIFQKVAMDRLWSVLNDAKGPQTEGDAKRGADTYAQLKNGTRANEFILDMAEAQAQREKAKAEFYKHYLPEATKKGDLTSVDRKWSERVPSIFDMPTMKKWGKP